MFLSKLLIAISCCSKSHSLRVVVGNFQGGEIVRYQSLDDRPRRFRPAQGESATAHFIDTRGIIKQTVDLEGDRCHLVALHGDSVLEQMITVALFLSRYWTDNNHWQPTGQRLRGGQTARLANEKIRDFHQVRHSVGVPQNPEI